MFGELPAELEALCLQSCWRWRRSVDVSGEKAEGRATADSAEKVTDHETDENTVPTINS